MENLTKEATHVTDDNFYIYYKEPIRSFKLKNKIYQTKCLKLLRIRFSFTKYITLVLQKLK